jgi:hypothetical protein
VREPGPRIYWAPCFLAALPRCNSSRDDWERAPGNSFCSLFPGRQPHGYAINALVRRRKLQAFFSCDRLELCILVKIHNLFILDVDNQILGAIAVEIVEAQ